MLASHLEAILDWAAAGLAPAVVADLGAGTGTGARLLAEATGADLVWTASALHHLTEPARLLREAHAALTPGAVLVAVEIAELPRFLPTGFGEGLEDRLRDAMAAAGWNRHDDWQADLEAAGFTVERRVFAGAVDPVPPATAAYAQAWLGRVRHGLGDALTAADRDLLDELLGAGPEGLRRRADLTLRGARVAWLARRR